MQLFQFVRNKTLRPLGVKFALAHNQYFPKTSTSGFYKYSKRGKMTKMQIVCEESTNIIFSKNGTTWRTDKPFFIASSDVLSIFDNIAKQTLNDKSVIFRVIVLYIRVKYLMEKLSSSKNIKPEEKKSLSEKLAINVYLITANLDAYQAEVKALLAQAGGKKRKQKGGMDTAKIYNAQGLVQELSALNQNDTVSPAVLFPSPFSASSLTSSGSVTDTLPPDTVAALMPAIPIPQTGGKKKVKSAKKNKH